MVVIIPLECEASFQSEDEEQYVTMLMEKSLQVQLKDIWMLTPDSPMPLKPAGLFQNVAVAK